MANSVDPDHLASVKPTDLDLYCLQMRVISGFSRTRVKILAYEYVNNQLVFFGELCKLTRSACKYVIKLRRALLT